ncbi:hypothetical protein [Paenirhodobacter populi]|uniref:Uncharacterized protein n=1 Tax=Paenirhodobacter populi TaxID=2306993 RepID=A0A443JRE5_9RHOB|nr:hypothetical protein [Sinirhodobacter populi]RWR23083.1 hypothetical protein D2T30_05535 [Sinirhodobacter populi]
MSAQQIFTCAPLGALLRYSDGKPKPPARFTKRLAAWQRSNGCGRLVRKDPGRSGANGNSFPATITLHEGDFSSAGVILVVMHRTYSVASELKFEIAELPRPGMVRVVQIFGDTTELLHLAESQEAAELWLAKNPYHLARFEVVEDATPPEPAMALAA